MTAATKPRLLTERADRLEALIKAIWHVTAGPFGAGDEVSWRLIQQLTLIAEDEVSSLQRGIAAARVEETACPN